MEIFDKNVDLFQKVLDLRSAKNEVLTANISNRETPGYKALDVIFEQKLQDAYYDKRSSPLKVTDPRHFSGDGRPKLNSFNPDITKSYNPEVRMDENSVDLDQELAKMTTNQLMFEANIRMISGKLQTLKDAIIEGGR
ncbi:MAG: flagellar basal body rod protein FlgB [SAR324 cluster bacterium]|nr:flagellar basal body rod protein FlgB [SAR324 cluster bacterium]